MPVTLDFSDSPLIRGIIERGREEAFAASLQRVVNRVLMDRLGIHLELARQMTDFLMPEELEAVLHGAVSVGHAPASAIIPSPRASAAVPEPASADA